MGVVTPEDPYPIWEGSGQSPLTVAPMFLLYDYSWRPEGLSQEEALAAAVDEGVLCTDEFLLQHDPYESRAHWCWDRVEVTKRRLAEVDPDAPPVLINHYPLHRSLLAPLRYPTFSLWCGTTQTADWPTRFNAAAVVYGHLHIPRTTVIDGVPHYEVSLGYPNEWRPRPTPPALTVIAT